MLQFQPSKMKLVLVTSSSFLASAGLLWNNLIKSDKHLDISWLWFSSVGISTFPFSFLVWSDLTKDFFLSSLHVPVQYYYWNSCTELIYELSAAYFVEFTYVISCYFIYEIL